MIKNHNLPTNLIKNNKKHLSTKNYGPKKKNNAKIPKTNQKQKPQTKKTTKIQPINLSGTCFKNPKKNKKNHSGKILSAVFKQSNHKNDSSCKTKYQYTQQKKLKNNKNTKKNKKSRKNIKFKKNTRST